MTTIKDKESFYAQNRQAWRQWLKENAINENSIWLIIFHKNSSTPSITYDEAVEEALCFGWIDSKPNKRDYESYFLFFSKRNPKSNWSKANKQRAQRMIKSKQMTPKGLEMIAIAKKTGTWDALEEVQASIIPKDLKDALLKNKKANEHFQSFPPSSKRIILEWILNAKKIETRINRIRQTVELAEKGLKANHYRQ